MDTFKKIALVACACVALSKGNIQNESPTKRQLERSSTTPHIQEPVPKDAQPVFRQLTSGMEVAIANKALETALPIAVSAISTLAKPAVGALSTTDSSKSDVQKEPSPKQQSQQPALKCTDDDDQIQRPRKPGF